MQIVMRTRRSAYSSSDPTLSSVERGSSNQGGHVPVLLHEALEILRIEPGDVVVDATLGGAGHARAIVEQIGSHGVFIGIDADSEAVERARVATEKAVCAVYLAQGNFRTLTALLRERQIPAISQILFDLGWSSYQLAVGRGFSFLRDEPLSMTFDDRSAPDTLTAERILNTWGEASLADVIYGWGEERNARRIARAIVEARSKTPIRTSRVLAEIVRGAVPPAYARGRLHPATRTFQALRIAVNDEIGALREGLAAGWHALKRGGRMAVISFHSIEDREVKETFRRFAAEGRGRILTKKPIIPTVEEIRSNPKSRSAKLRGIEKI